MKSFLGIIFVFLLSSSVQAIYLSPCYNYGDQVSFSFESCINRNFRDIDHALDRRVWPQHCFASQGRADFSFVSCINRNFRYVENVLGRIYLEHCYNSNEQVTFGFESCVNRNFRSIEREILELPGIEE